MSLITACTSGVSASNKRNCSAGGEVCINMSAAASFQTDEPVAVKIEVTSLKDISDLQFTLDPGTEVTVEGPQSWEKYLSNPCIGSGYAWWNFTVKAGQTLTFNRVLNFPSKEGYFHILATVANSTRNIVATDSVYVVLWEGVGQVILAGTPLPRHTPNVTSAVFEPGTPTPPSIKNPANLSNPTSIPCLSTNLTPTPIVPLVVTSTASTPPYPPPSTPYP